MNTATPGIQSLAHKLIAIEAAQLPANLHCNSAMHACNRIRVPLSRLAGVGGFRALMSRALALAKAEVPELELVELQADGYFDIEFVGKTLTRGDVSSVNAGFTILTQLLGLLITFIGEPLTLALIREAWPGISAEEQVQGAEDQS